MSGKIRSLLKATEYLHNHSYEKIATSLILHKTISYKANTGDDSWENGLAHNAGFIRLERGDCCRKIEKDFKKHTSKSTMFCLECNTPLKNKGVAWKIDENRKLTNELKASFNMESYQGKR